MSGMVAAADPILGELHAGFLASAEAFPNRPALEVCGKPLTYAELRGRAATMGPTLASAAPQADPPLTGVFAYRSETAYAGLLGALLRGHGYVALSRLFP